MSEQYSRLPQVPFQTPVLNRLADVFRPDI